MKVGYRRVSTVEQKFDRQELGELDKLFEEKVSGSYVVRLPLGHYPHIENPKAVLDAFYAFHARL